MPKRGSTNYFSVFIGCIMLILFVYIFYTNFIIPMMPSDDVNVKCNTFLYPNDVRLRKDKSDNKYICASKPKCRSDQVLSSTEYECLDSCPTGEFVSSGTPKRCVDKCGDTDAISADKLSCVKCISPEFLGPNKKCVRECPDGYIGNKEYGKCISIVDSFKLPVGVTIYSGNNGTVSGRDYCLGNWGSSDGNAKSEICLSGYNTNTMLPVKCDTALDTTGKSDYSYYCAKPTYTGNNGAVSSRVYCLGNWESTDGLNKNMMAIGTVQTYQRDAKIPGTPLQTTDPFPWFNPNDATLRTYCSPGNFSSDGSQTGHEVCKNNSQSPVNNADKKLKCLIGVKKDIGKLISCDEIGRISSGAGTYDYLCVP
jgi:hypothetical protein